MKRLALAALAGAVVSLIGSTGARADGSWEYRTLMTKQITTGVDEAVLTIDGQVNSLDDRVYDVKFTFEDGTFHTLHVYTGRTAQQPLHARLVTVVTDAVVTIGYRYDASQPVCLIGLDDTCAYLFLDPANVSWFAGSPTVQRGRIDLSQDPWQITMPTVSTGSAGGEAAELIAQVGAKVNDAATTQTIHIPFAGQLLSALGQ
jgi:hypothetical protein